MIDKTTQNTQTQLFEALKIRNFLVLCNNKISCLKKISLIVVNLLPHPQSVQIDCSRMLILQSYGLGPVQGKDTHTLMTHDPFICGEFKNQYLKPERSLGRKICQTQLNP